MKQNPVKILILEDIESDYLILKRNLQDAEFPHKTVFADDKENFIKQIKEFVPDLILSDYNLPGFSGIEALEIKKELCPDVPFILVTGFLSEEEAVDKIKKGVWDYILKDNYARLLPSVEAALKYKREKENVLTISNQLRQSNQKFETIFNNVTQPIFILQLSNNILPVIEYANKVAENLIKKDIIGKPISILIPYVTEDEVRYYFNEIKKNKTIRELITFKSSSGIIYFQISAGSVFIDNEQKVLVSATDVTEKHIAQIKLEDQKNIFKNLYEKYLNQNSELQETIQHFKKSQKELAHKINIINRSPAVVFLWENKSGWPVKYVSKNVKELTGYSSEDFENQNILFEDIIHQEDLQRIKSESAKSVFDLKNNTIKQTTYRIITKQGLIKWVTDDTRIIIKNGESVEYEGILYDISDRIKAQQELKESEKKYRSILENNPDSILIISADRKIKYLNSKAKILFGNAEENTSCFKSLFGYDKPCSWCGISLTDNYNIYQDEIILPKNNRTYLYSISKINDNNGQSNLIISYSDITDLKRLQKEKLYFMDALDKELNEIYFININDFKIIYTNTLAEINLNADKKTVYGKRIYNFQTGQSKKSYQKYLYRLTVKKENKIQFESFHIKTDGSKYPVSVTLKLSNYKEKKVIAVIVRDISEQIEKEKTIKLLSAAVHQSKASIVITDADGNIEYVNPWFTMVSGYSAEEVLGKNPRILKSGHQPDEFYQQLWNTITSGNIWEGEFLNKKKNGDFYWEDVIINPVVNASGNITHFIGIKQDITEEKKMREQLEKSEEHFRLLFENSLIGMYLINSEGEIIDANKTFLKILGYEAIEDIRYKKLDELKNITANRDEFRKLIQKNNHLAAYESIWKDKNQNLIYVRENTRKYIDSEGKEFYEGTIEDITEQKVAIKKLKELHQFNENLIKEGKLGYAVYQKDGKCTNVNDEYAKIVGGKPEDILTKNFYQNKKWKKYNLIETAEKCLELGIHNKQIIIDTSSYGKDIFAEMSFNRIYYGKEPLLLVILKDISSFIRAKRRQMQTKSEYINLIESINVPVFGIDTEGKIKIWNSKIAELTGYSRSEIKNHFINEFIEDSKSSFFADLIKNAFSGRKLKDIEINFKTKNGSIIRLLLSSTLQLNDKEEIAGITGIAQDITEREKHKQELEKQIQERTHELITALKKEKEIGELKTKFVSMTSHEFRTPLSAIKMAAGYIRRYYDKAEKEKILLKTEKIEMQADHMTALLEDVLTIGKIENGKMKFTPEKLDFINAVKSIIEDVESATKNTHKIILETNVSELVINSDSKILRNIFTNLLTNAIKFSPDFDQVFVEIYAYSDHILCKVTDRGIGISKEDLKTIFTPFRRAENAETIQGTGLGLAIVKQSVDLLKGKIFVSSKEGEGTRFKILLPIKKNN